jgi:hypothetical protein
MRWVVLVAVVGVLACSGGSGQPFDRTINVWADDDGAYTCPPEAPIATSDPPVCAADPSDRIRLVGPPVADLTPADPTTGWVTTAHITGTLSANRHRLTVDSMGP